MRLDKTRDSSLLRVSGRIDAENIAELKTQLQDPLPIALELSEVTLVDAEAVRFLAAVETAGTELRNCPLFVREWIRREDLERSPENRSHVTGLTDSTGQRVKHRSRNSDF